MLSFPNAKINIGLNVLSKRPDGFHNLETCFYPLAFSDMLEFVPAATTQISVTGIVPDGNADDNLVMRAYRLLAEDFRLPPVKVHLHKQIPFGSGLGGGSSDAAFMISMICRHCSLPVDPGQQMKYAAKLGSDCPFFLMNSAALASGRGEVLIPAPVSLQGYHLLLVVPPVSVSTREAYAGIQPGIPSRRLAECIRQPVANWMQLIKNDFEEHVFAAYPIIRSLKESILQAGAVYASMSGSGSAVYGLFTQKPEDIRFPDHYFVWKEKL